MTVIVAYLRYIVYIEFMFYRTDFNKATRLGFALITIVVIKVMYEVWKFNRT